MSDFDKIIDRKNTKSEKYDFPKKHQVPEDVLPLWVADMDFQTPEEVREALHKAVDHGIFGYSGADEDYINSVLGWMEKHFNYKPDKEELVVTPGVVFAIAHAIRAFTERGDSILIQEPVYYPFRNEIERNDRTVVVNPLIEEDGKYSIDFEDFEKKVINSSPKLFILCNPHNPVGRVFTEDELRRMAEICMNHGVIMISDEIHADFIHGDHNHKVLANLGEEIAENSVICTAPSKTFNLAGLHGSNIFIKNKELREKFKRELTKSGAGSLNLLSFVATQAAYTYGDKWVEELNTYIEDNFKYINDFLKENIPEIKANYPEGTYLVWLDCRDLGLNDEELKNFFLNDAHLWLDEGSLFGQGGEGFMRLNAAAPRKVMEEAMDNLKNAVDNLKRNR